LPDQTTPFPAKNLPLLKALKGEESNNVEIFARNATRKDGVWINMTGRPLAGGKGGAVASFRDVTFAKVAADALAAKSEDISRSNRELEQFAYVASHDLQEPLRMVASYVQLLARRYKGKLDSEADEFIAYATDGAKRMQQLINDLLGYARIGQGHVVYQPIECQEVFDQVVESLDEKIREAGATLTHDALPQITANETQIIQLFQNLIENAIKFKSEEPPRIHVSAQAKKKQWIFSFSDNGVGIAPEYKDRVFVIFQPLHNREAYPGTGIGLAICKKIVEQHAGQIWVETKPRKGTEIRFSWPRNPNLEQGRKSDA
jgi:light-regulated signal transduction histidine kinase (bacteriophytochrome)